MSTERSAEEQLRWERRARALLQWTSVAVTRSGSIDSTLAELVAEVCRVTGWPVGHVLRLAPDGALGSTGIWHLADPVRFERFRARSAEACFRPGVGLPGRVLASGKALWIIDVARDANFPRAEAGDLGIHAAFAFPITLDRQVMAVLEFAATEAMEPDLPLLEVMETVGAQLGRILERSRAEEALRESEARYRYLTETANDAIVTADADGNVVSWNRCAERMFGHAEAEVRGRSLTLIIPERHRAAHEAGMARMRAGGPRHVIGRTVELEGLRRDGSEFPLELSLATWRLGERSFYTGILRDITERRQSEVRLRAAAEQLERSERAAVDASRAKSLFLANMSHELRTPLNAILGFVQLLERDRNLVAEQREHLAIISRSGEHLLGLINDVLSIAKIEAGETDLHPVDFELPRLLDSLREMFHLRAEARGLSLVFEHAELAPLVRGDEGKLRQVLINLLGNAVKFTAAGGVALRARGAGDRVAFEIEDTGPGMSPEEIAGLFQPFVQTSAGRRAQEGTGLGLSISRDFVRLLGGELRVASTLGEGTRFAFEIPLSPIAGGAARPARRRVLGLAAGSPEARVLVVDNAEDNRRLLSRLLRAVGFSVREAENGEQAIAEWRRFHPSFVWMDMRMPVMDGYEATRRIRAEEAQGGAPRTVIVALTASAFEHDRASIRAAGCDEILAKPFREDRVFETMAAHLGLRYVLDELVAAPVASSAPSPESLRALSAEIRTALRQALAAGDDLAAQRAIDRVTDRALATALSAMVRAFQLDELLGLLERS